MPEPWVVAVVAGVLGLTLGSFLNVCVFRWPNDLSVVMPPSHCPVCEQGIMWYDNVPVLSWILLRGRCRSCDTRISVQYPLVELATGLIWAGMFLGLGLSAEALRGSLFLTLLFGISLTDARYYIIPNQFSLGGAALGIALAFLPGGITGVQALAGAAVGYAVLWVVGTGGTWLLKRFFPERLEDAGVDQALGGGDVKMMAMVGAFLGIPGVFLTLFLGSLAGGLIFGPISLVMKRLIPFGIFLAAGAAVTWAWGDALVAWYLTTMLGL